MKVKVRGDWESLWRFLAVAMLFEVCWAVWIAIQINAPPTALPAAKVRATRNVEGQIRPADVIPPVNVDRLKLSDSIETAVPERP